MQRIEYRRHRADMAEARSETGSEAFRQEMAEIAREWRDLVREIEELDQLSSAPLNQGKRANA